MAVETYGKLLIVGKDGKSELEDHACDIRIVNKEISRKHAEIYTEGNGSVFVNSMGREPVSVNGVPVVSPLELITGDKIEVHLEGRTRIFYFHSNDDAVHIAGRKPLKDLNAASMSVTSPPKPEIANFSRKNDGDEGAMPSPPPQDNAQKASEEFSAPAPEATIQEEEIPMAVEAPMAPDSADQVENFALCTAPAAPLDKTEKLPAFEAMDQEHDAENEEQPPIDATEKIEFPMEEEMMEAEPMIMHTTEEEIFEVEEPQQQEENTAQLVSRIVSKAIAAALLAENTNNVPSEPENVKNIDKMMVDEEGLDNVQGLVADNPALCHTEGCAPSSTCQKTKKSVRFSAAGTGTPEGAAYDIPGALPLDLMANSTENAAAVVVVDDSTIAFAQWAGLASAFGDAEEEQAMNPDAHKQVTTDASERAPDTLIKAKAQVAQFVQDAIAAAVDAAAASPADVSAGSRRQSAVPNTLIKAKTQVSKFVSEAIAAAVEAAATPVSAGRRQSAAPDTLIKAKAQVSKFVAEAIAAASSPAPDAAYHCQSEAPNTLVKAKAHVAQFVSEAIEAAVAGCATPRTGALAAKLTELEQEHDITFELPADFMRWTPDPATSKKLLSIAVAVNPRGEDAKNAAATTPAATRTTLAPQQLAAKLAELKQEHDITFELPVDFMRWTPVPASVGKKAIVIGVTPRSSVAVAAAKAATTSKAGMTPAGPGAQAPAPTPNTAITTNKSAGVVKRKMSLDPTSLAAKLSEIADKHDVDFELPADFMRWTPAAKRTVSIAVTPRTMNAPASVAKSQRSAPRSAVRILGVTPAKGMTPAGPGAQAPATTPATIAKSIGKMSMPGAGGFPVDTTALATKLAVLAEQHEITFELPADFMRWTPAPGNKTSGNVIIAPVSAMKSQQRSAGRSRMAQAVDTADDTEMFPEEVMQPVAEKNVNNGGEFGSALAASLEAVASARKTTTPISKRTAADSLSRQHRRSSIRTPGTKIAIIGRSTPRSTAPSSVKNIRTTAENNFQQKYQEEEEDIEMGEAAEVAPHPVTAEVIEKEASGETLERKESHEAEIDDADIAVEEVVAQDEEEIEEEDEDFDFVEEQSAEEEAAGLRHVAFVPLADYRRAVVQVRIHRSRATGLATQLRGVSARALRLKRAASGLAKALEEERAKREELQATLQRIVANREAEEGDDDVMDCDGNQEEALVSPVQARVVVLGYNPDPQPCRVELAGNVVVVRPTQGMNTTTTPAKSPTKASVGFAAGVVAKTPIAGNKTATKSKTPGTLKKTVGKTPTGGRVLDDVEVPSWVFETETAGVPAVDVAAELAEVAAAEGAEARDAAALKNLLQAEVAAQAKATDSEDDEVEEADDEGADHCHKCNEGEEGDVLLLCDGCENACHLSCCNPPLKRVPKGDWFCDGCKKAKKSEEAAAKKAPAGGKKRAAAAAAASEPAVAEEKKAIPAARAGKKAIPATKKPAAGTKRGRGVAAPTAQEEKAPAAKKTRGGRQAAPASTEKPAAAKRTTRTRK